MAIAGNPVLVFAAADAGGVVQAILSVRILEDPGNCEVPPAGFTAAPHSGRICSERAGPGVCGGRRVDSRAIGLTTHIASSLVGRSGRVFELRHRVQRSDGSPYRLEIAAPLATGVRDVPLFLWTWFSGRACVSPDSQVHADPAGPDVYGAEPIMAASPTVAMAPQTEAERAPGTRTPAVIAALVVLAIVLGFICMWRERYEMGSDGVAYLDLGDAWWRGDWRNAVNGLWSPLYSVLIGGVLALFRPSTAMEFPVVHFANYALYLVSLAAFVFLVRSLERARIPHSGRSPLPGWVLWSFAGVAFLAASVRLTTVSPTTPDVLVSAALYAALGIMTRLLEDPLERRWYVLLGAVPAPDIWRRLRCCRFRCSFLALSRFAEGRAVRWFRGLR